MKPRDRYPKFKKGPNGEKLCRGCGALVPKGRQTWCSNECYMTRCPREVDSAVFKRDKGICCLCGRDTERLRLACFRGERFRVAARKAGWPRNHRWWEADHIIPHSEGGEYILENLRTLCVPCHKARTKKWHQARHLSGTNERTHDIRTQNHNQDLHDGLTANLRTGQVPGGREGFVYVSDTGLLWA